METVICNCRDDVYSLYEWMMEKEILGKDRVHREWCNTLVNKHALESIGSAGGGGGAGTISMAKIRELYSNINSVNPIRIPEYLVDDALRTNYFNWSGWNGINSV